MVNIKIKRITLFLVEDGEAVYSQPNQDQERTVAQTMNSLLPKFRLKLKKLG